MTNSSTKEIIKEARSHHPDISDAVVDKLSNFLASELNENELNLVSLKQITGELLVALVNPTAKNEN